MSQLYPIGKRDGYFAIKAFYVCLQLNWRNVFFPMTSEQDELAMIQDNVSSSIIGEMRMQFWRDAVKALVDVRRPPIYCPTYWS